MVPDGYRPLGLQVGIWIGRWSAEEIGQTLWLLGLLGNPVVLIQCLDSGMRISPDCPKWLQASRDAVRAIVQGIKYKRDRVELTAAEFARSTLFTSFYSSFSPVQLILCSPVKYITSSNYCYINISPFNVALMYICLVLLIWN